MGLLMAAAVAAVDAPRQLAGALDHPAGAVRIGVADAVGTHAFDQRGFTEDHGPCEHCVVRRVMDGAVCADAEFAGVDVCCTVGEREWF